MPASRPVIRTPDQRLRVFVSSTLKELAEERAAARRAIESLRLHPVMFELSARPHPPRELYRHYLEQSHVFIGIYWEQYGWVTPGREISGLEDEFLLAGELPKLIYFKTPAPNREPGLKKMVARIKNDSEISYKYFSEPEELGELIRNDLALLLTERFRAVPPAARGDHPGASGLSRPTPRPAALADAVDRPPAGTRIRRGAAGEPGCPRGHADRARRRGQDQPGIGAGSTPRRGSSKMASTGSPWPLSGSRIWSSRRSPRPWTCASASVTRWLKA